MGMGRGRRNLIELQAVTCLCLDVHARVLCVVCR